MHSRILFVVTFLAVAHAADHNVFKNCSSIPLCQSLRTAYPDHSSKFSVNVNSLKIDSKGVAHVELVNQQNVTLNLEITRLTKDQFRVIVEETDSKRFRLKGVLNGGEPPIKKLVLVSGDPTEAVLTGDDDTSIRVELIVSPLAIEFYKNDVLETRLDGERLIFQQGTNAFAFQVLYPQAVTIYGIHEHAENLTLQNTHPEGTDPYRLRNLDVSGYELNSPMALYGSVPVIYGHGPEVTAGIFIHNAAEQWIDVEKNDTGSKLYIMVESGLLDLFILLGPTPKDVVRQYTNLTGVAHLPQFWALGYHQCRWNYMSQEDVKDVIANMDSHDFPMDVIWLDIEYTDGKRYFTWNPTNFSDPVEMQKNISSTNRKLVTIIDPHIKVDPDYAVYSGALEKDLFVKNANGSVFEGDCWPGKSSYMDFLNTDASDYYASFYSFEKFVGSTETLAGIWNDMNEPSVFDDSIEKTLPGDSLHYGGVQHRDIHNIYGFLHAKSTHQGLMERDGLSKRPFVLTRSHFAGTQRYALIWTGDNTADWGYLAISYAECLNANILGLVFCGADVGGFAGDPDVELLQRWYQAGVWLPFYRAHADINTKRREPYLFPDDVQAVIRDAMKLRYKHLHVWYTLFFEHTRHGDPIIRPLFYDYPSDLTAMQVDTQVLVGSDILAKAVYEPGVTSVDVYLPGENVTWYQINKEPVAYLGSKRYNIDVDLSSIPVFYKSGGIIARKEQSRPSSKDMQNDPFTLFANLDKSGAADCTLYVDDFESFDYENDQFDYVKIEYKNDALSITHLNGSADYKINIEAVVVNLFPENGQGAYKQAVYNTTPDGTALKDVVINLKEYTFISLK